MNNAEIKLTHIPFEKDTMKSMPTIAFNNFPVVYILHNDLGRPTAYIGESVHIRNRLRNHITDSEKQKKLDKATIIEHNHFNRSATYNIETNLINYFIADQKYKLLNQFHNLTILIGFQAIQKSGRMKVVLDEHRLIIDMLEKKDKEGMVNAIQRHLKATLGVLYE